MRLLFLETDVSAGSGSGEWLLEQCRAPYSVTHLFVDLGSGGDGNFEEGGRGRAPSHTSERSRMSSTIVDVLSM